MLSKVKGSTTELLHPITEILVRTGIKPNHLTFLGLVVGFVASYLITIGNLRAGALVIILSGLMDMLDGALARNKGLITKFGGYLDSVFDRYVDIALFTALGLSGYVDWFLVVLAMSGALMVSYTRARAENIIDRCDVGIAERSERLLILVFGLLSGYVWHAVLIIAILSHLTAIHRIAHTYCKSGGS
jgi:archaetidylinositol phosphate synthase